MAHPPLWCSGPGDTAKQPARRDQTVWPTQDLSIGTAAVQMCSVAAAVAGSTCGSADHPDVKAVAKMLQDV